MALHRFCVQAASASAAKEHRRTAVFVVGHAGQQLLHFPTAVAASPAAMGRQKPAGDARGSCSPCRMSRSTHQKAPTCPKHRALQRPHGKVQSIHPAPRLLLARKHFHRIAAAPLCALTAISGCCSHRSRPNRSILPTCNPQGGNLLLLDLCTSLFQPGCPRIPCHGWHCQSARIGTASFDQQCQVLFHRCSNPSIR